MGVPGLWDILRPAGKQRSLAQLAVYDGFERNPGGRRGLRVGIDASIWFFHATYGREGENPELRTLFFRCARLMARPFLPLFVFDGPHRPELKRKKKISGKDHWMVSGMQEIIEAFGFEWWCAPGEAEAELAYLNRIGVIDAIITDDVDTFLFGAVTIIRNPGAKLSGNSAHPVKNTAGKDDGEHSFVYTAADIADHPDVSLSQDGLILIALLRGGDYAPEGLDNCGAVVAHALARCGFGETLLIAARNLPHSRLPAFLDGWRNEVRAELRSNSRGFLNTRKVQLSKNFPDTFPDIKVLQLYTHPVTSERKNARPEFLWNREPDLMKLAALCERKFEWGVREIIIKRFRTVMWAPIVLRIMRRAVLDADTACPSTPKKKGTSRNDDALPGTPSKMITRHFSMLSVSDKDDDSQRLIIGIHGKREHHSTDGIPEYRLEIAPAQLARLTAAGVQGTRIPPSQYRPDWDDGENFDVDGDDEEEKEDGRKSRKRKGPKSVPPEPDSHLRIWMPVCIVERVEPVMVAAYEGKVAQKVRDKEEKAAKKGARAAAGAEPKPKSRSKTQMSGAKAKKIASKRTEREEEEEEELSAGEDFSHVFGLPSKTKGKPKATAPSRSKSNGRRKYGLSVREEEEEEEEELSIPSQSRNAKTKSIPLAEVTNDSPDRRPETAAAKRPSRASTGGGQTSPTKLSKTKTILDLLDEGSHKTSSKATSATSVSSPPKVLPISSKPFPMSKVDDDVFLQQNVPRPLQNESTSKAASRHHSTVKSKSDSEGSIHSSPKKSPRKNKNHNSPKSFVIETITDSDSENDHKAGANQVTRPVSPTPSHPKASPNTQQSLRNTTLLQSKTTAASALGLVSASNISTAASKSASMTKIKSFDVIEITSDSESEQVKPKQIEKTTMPVSSKRVSSRHTEKRLDAMFRTVKPNLSGIWNTAQAKSSATKAKSRRIPTHDDNVIEIL